MTSNKNSMAIIILCSHLCVGEDTQPFSPKEWSKLAMLLVKKNRTPSDLLSLKREELKEKLYFSDQLIYRLEKLISRSVSLTFELEKLLNMGIHIVTRADAEYPIMLKRTLRHDCPPLFYYAGDIGLVNKKLIGFVGSRSVEESDKDFTKKIVNKVLEKGYGIVSGGAKGVDSVSSEYAIEKNGFAVEYLSDSLIKKMKRTEVIKDIRNNRLLLLSAVNPSAGFTVGNAMMRNKFIYASSIGTVVVKSDFNKGGTWAGAIESLKNDWTHVFCWNNKLYQGNNELIKKGAIAIDEHWEVNLTLKELKKKIITEQISLFNE